MKIVVIQEEIIQTDISSPVLTRLSLKFLHIIPI